MTVCLSMVLDIACLMPITGLYNPPPRHRGSSTAANSAVSVQSPGGLLNTNCRGGHHPKKDVRGLRCHPSIGGTHWLAPADAGVIHEQGIRPDTVSSRVTAGRPKIAQNIPSVQRYANRVQLPVNICLSLEGYELIDALFTLGLHEARLVVGLGLLVGLWTRSVSVDRQTKRNKAISSWLTDALEPQPCATWEAGRTRKPLIPLILQVSQPFAHHSIQYRLRVVESNENLTTCPTTRPANSKYSLDYSLRSDVTICEGYRMVRAVSASKICAMKESGTMGLCILGLDLDGEAKTTGYNHGTAD
ncbi:hypothetical protein QX201_008005 [Fusarium graminearum]